MRIFKCDMCKMEIKDGDYCEVHFYTMKGKYGIVGFELCMDCCEKLKHLMDKEKHA